VREFEERHAPRWVKSSLSVGTVVLLATGFFVGVVLRSMLLGVLLFALGAILFAVRGYLNTGDKAVAGALIFVALVAIGIEAIVYFLDRSGRLHSRWPPAYTFTPTNASTLARSSGFQVASPIHALVSPR
jgi:hypothetical protein